MEKYHSVIISLNEVKLKDFQYKITNKILVTKSFLYRINKTNDNLCEYCHQQPETIFHLFVECEEVKQFRNLLNNWLSAVSNSSIGPSLASMTSRRQIQDGGPHTSDPRWRPPRRQIQDGGPHDFPVTRSVTPRRVSQRPRPREGSVTS